MAADLREMQENQGLSEKQIDKLRFVYLLLYCNPSFLSMCNPAKKQTERRMNVSPFGHRSSICGTQPHGSSDGS